MTNIVNDLRLLESGARWVDSATADVLERAADEIERLREMNKRLMAAVWMVGNMDTDHDKCAWWATFDPLWKEVAQEPRVQEWADRAALKEMGHE